MSQSKIISLVNSIQRSRAIARCFDVQIPKFHYTHSSQVFDKVKYDEDMESILRFNKHPVVIKCSPIHWSNLIPDSNKDITYY